MLAVAGSLQPGEVVLEAGQVLHEFDLLLFAGAERLLDVVELGPDGLHLLQGEVAGTVDAEAGTAQSVGRRVFGFYAKKQQKNKLYMKNI